jgi:hypothetical protein
MTSLRLLGAAVLVALAASGVVWARGSSEITACVERATGYLKIGSCGGSTLTWNTQGPKGDPGPAGPAGAPGSIGPVGTVAGLKQVIIAANSAVSKAAAHSAAAQCPPGATVLYGGAGLIATPHPDSAYLRLTYSRPSVRQGAIRGWSAGAVRIRRPDPLNAFLLALALRSGYEVAATGALLAAGDAGKKLVAKPAKDTGARFDQAVSAAKEFALAAPSAWGVQAWVVCGS